MFNTSIFSSYDRNFVSMSEVGFKECENSSTGKLSFACESLEKKNYYCISLKIPNFSLGFGPSLREVWYFDD